MPSFLCRFASLTLAVALVLQACAGANTARTPTTPPPVSHVDGGANVTPVDVVLLGLPTDGGHVTGEDGSVTEGGSPIALTPGGGPNGELILPLRADARAPFNGVLFNGPAVARVAVEFRAQQDRCTIDRQHDVALVVARYNADVASLNLALNTQRRMDQVLLNGRDNDIARLNRLLEQQNRAANGPHIGEGLIWAGGGLLLGVAIVGGIVLFTNIRP